MGVRDFEEQLRAVTGKIRHVNLWNEFDRYHDGILYYLNKAKDLKHAAKSLLSENSHENEVALMLAGLSIEVLLKGIILGLQDVFPHCHNLECLIATSGIRVSDKDHETSRILTEYIVWAAKYPTPKEAEDWFLKETGGWPLSRDQRWTNSNQGDEYTSLWDSLEPYFWRVNDSTLESADLKDLGKITERKKNPKHKHLSRLL